MSTVSVTNINTKDNVTDLTIGTGNVSSGTLVFKSASKSIVANATITSNGLTIVGGVMNYSKGATIVTGSTTDIWTPADGNFLHANGSASIVSFGTAPQSGVTRWIRADTAFTIVNNANNAVQGNNNYTTTTGDILQIIADTTTTTIVNVYRSNILPSIPPIIKAADETRSSTTLTNDTDFVVTVAANKNYRLRGRFVITTSATASTGMAIGFTAPAAFTSAMLSAAYNVGVGSFGGWTTAVSTPVGGTLTVGSSINGAADFELIFKNGANAGNLQIQTAQNTAGGTLTIKALSYMTVENF